MSKNTLITSAASISAAVRESASPKVRFGLVGAGAIAQAYAQAFRECGSAELVALADVRPEVGTAMANSLGIPAYTSYEEMVAAADLDAAVVCTPPATHAEICIGLLQNKIHVLCEKPLTTDSETARKMLRTAEESGGIYHDGIQVSPLRSGCRPRQEHSRFRHPGGDRSLPECIHLLCFHAGQVERAA